LVFGPGGGVKLVFLLFEGGEGLEELGGGPAVALLVEGVGTLVLGDLRGVGRYLIFEVITDYSEVTTITVGTP